MQLSFSARVAAVCAFRFGCYAAMAWVCLWAEARPAPSLPDAVLAHVPYVAWIDRYNYVLWLVAYVPIALSLLATNGERFIRYMFSAGLLALIRGACIAATGIGPVRGADINAGISFEQRVQAFKALLWPSWLVGGDAAHVYLTKDLFFSGHTATTFLLLLYVWPYRWLRWPMLVSHLLVVTSLFFSHLHYTIDVIGAYAIAFSLFALRERVVRLEAAENDASDGANSSMPDRATPRSPAK